MALWYGFWDWMPFEMLHWDFMKNALLAVVLMAPLFGLLSTMIVTGRMSFFSDALGHSAFTGIAIGCICGVAAPTWVAVLFSVAFALLFSFVRSRSNQAADTLIGVFSSAAVALGIFIATLGGGSFTNAGAGTFGRDRILGDPGQPADPGFHPSPAGILPGCTNRPDPDHFHRGHCRGSYPGNQLGWPFNSQFSAGIARCNLKKYCA